MIAQSKADEIAKNIMTWLEQNAKKVVLKKSDGTVLAETTNFQVAKDSNNQPRVWHANGYSICRADAYFHLNSSPSADIIVDIVDVVDQNNNPLLRNYYIGSYNTQDFTVAFEVAVPYIVDIGGSQ